MKLEDFSFRNRKQEKFCLVNNVKRYKNSNYALISFSTPNCLGQILISIFYIHFVLLQSTFHPANKTASIHTLSLYQTPCINARCNPTISTDATPILSTPISITTPRSLNTRYSTAQTRCPRNRAAAAFKVQTRWGRRMEEDGVEETFPQAESRCILSHPRAYPHHHHR